MSCKLSDKCDNVFACNVLRPNVELLGCNFYKPKKPMTNEEYLRSLNTEQLAKFIFWQHFDVYGKTLYELMVNASKGVSRDKQAEVMIGAVIEWLKETHE